MFWALHLDPDTLVDLISVYQDPDTHAPCWESSSGAHGFSFSFLSMCSFVLSWLISCEHMARKLKLKPCAPDEDTHHGTWVSGSWYTESDPQECLDPDATPKTWRHDTDTNTKHRPWTAVVSQSYTQWLKMNWQKAIVAKWLKSWTHTWIMAWNVGWGSVWPVLSSIHNWGAPEQSKPMDVCRGVMHSLFLRGHKWVVGGGIVIWHTAATMALWHNGTIYFFLFIQNIPKRINYIMKYIDCHRDYDGQSSLIMYINYA